jgi:hypothetical protein
LSREISIFRSEINALLDFEGAVNVGRDFTPKATHNDQLQHFPALNGSIREWV